MKQETFWARVDMSPFGCWVYNGPTDKDGYGRVGGERAHRIAFKFAYGPIPPGMLIRHSCDNPPCVRPDHLDVGTQKDNMHDKLVRGRYRNGYENWTSCSKGHERTNSTVREYMDKNGHHHFLCIPCERIRGARYRERKRRSA